MLTLPETDITPPYIDRMRKLIRILITLLFIGIIFASLIVYFANKPPSHFPQLTPVVISDGISPRQISEQLQDAQIIHSSLLLRVILHFFYPHSYILAGTYQFTDSISTFMVAQALTQGTYMSPTYKITFPEGFSVRDFETYLPEKFRASNTQISLQSYEGKLFPDTYFITDGMSADDILKLLSNTMNAKLLPLLSRIDEKGMTQNDVLILASILEREAKDEISMKHISGILQNRLAIDMPLQTDATLDYILNKTSNELTLDDLAFDSPYNTYLHTGLPPTPISNPGLVAINAVLYPIQTDDLYYLTGTDGNFYYAKTFEEHKRNKKKYLP